MEQNPLAISPCGSAEALNAGLFISPGYGRHPERTIDSNELIFVKAGVLGIREGEDSFEVGPGQTLLLRAGLPHGGTAEYSSELQFYWIHFRLRAGLPPEGAMPLPRVSSLRRPERMVELLRIFLDDQESGELSKARADALMELILLETLEARSNSSIPASDSDSRLAESAENLMRARFRDSGFTASALAEALKCNPDYLNRVYRRVKGMTLTASLQRLRVNLAAQLLLDGHTNVEEAAAQSGFSERCYMRRVFKKLKGMPPKDYRMLHLKMHINTR